MCFELSGLYIFYYVGLIIKIKYVKYFSLYLRVDWSQRLLKDDSATAYINMAVAVIVVNIKKCMMGLYMVCINRCR